MKDEQREIIDWLNSFEGRKWSQRHFRQSPNAIKMFSLKEQECADIVNDQEWYDWGWVDLGGKYRSPERGIMAVVRTARRVNVPPCEGMVF